MPKQPVVDLHLRLPPDLADQLAQLAAVNRRSQNAEVDVALETWVERLSSHPARSHAPHERAPQLLTTARGVGKNPKTASPETLAMTTLSHSTPVTKPRRDAGDGSIFERPDRPITSRWCGGVDLGTQGGKHRRKYVYGKTRRAVQQQLAELRHLQSSSRQQAATLMDQYLDQVTGDDTDAAVSSSSRTA